MALERKDLVKHTCKKCGTTTIMERQKSMFVLNVVMSKP